MDSSSLFGNSRRKVYQSKLQVELLEARNLLAGVTARHVFYNDSSFDGQDMLASPQDDGAIAPDKVALLPGETATFANYTGYSRGLNGIMVDIEGVADPLALSATDFEFRVGNSDAVDAWMDAPAPQNITTRVGEGVGGSDRVTVIWNDNDIQKQWLEVRVLPTVNTGLSQVDVHYWGNAVGEVGDSTTNAYVNATDIVLTRDNPHNFLLRAAIDDAYDHNRDTLVNATDIVIVRDNPTNFLNGLRLISPPELPKQPNIILINTDDQRADTLQYMPTTTQWLVEQGTVFENAFVDYSP
ncbi:MAG: hypothetical protein AAF497_29720 [Planctomycetota bacterium]